MEIWVAACPGDDLAEVEIQAKDFRTFDAFSLKIQGLPEKIRRANYNIFRDWLALLVGIATCVVRNESKRCLRSNLVDYALITVLQGWTHIMNNLNHLQSQSSSYHTTGRPPSLQNPEVRLLSKCTLLSFAFIQEQLCDAAVHST